MIRIPALILISTLAPVLSVNGNAQTPSRFTYSPQVVSPGEAIAFQAENIRPGVAGIRIVMGAHGAPSVAAWDVAVVNGAFSGNLTIPAGVPAGRYGVGLVEPGPKGGINLTGSIAVAPTTLPWFRFSPNRVASGGSLNVAARLFSPGTLWAIVGLVNSANQIRWIGSSALTTGAFDKTFPLPGDLPSGRTYNLIVYGSTGEPALDVTGPASIVSARTSLPVPVGRYPVGVDVDTVNNRIYVPSSADNTLSVVNGNTNQVVATIPLGDLPCAIASNPYTKRIYVANFNASTVSVVDATTLTVIATVPTGGLPCAMTVLPGLNRIYAGNYLDNSLTVINGANNQVIQTVSLPGAPYGLSSSPTLNRVYIASGITNTLEVLNGLTLETIASVPVGKIPDAVAVNPQNKRVYVANFYGDSLTVIDGTTHSVVATVRVGKQPSGVAVSPTTGRVYVGNYSSDTVTVLNGSTNAVIDTVAVGTTPDGIAVNWVTNKVYSADSNSNMVTVLNDVAP